MKKLITILLFLISACCFGQTQIKINQADTTTTGFLPKSVASSTYVPQTTSISMGVGLIGGGTLASNMTIGSDTTVMRTTANSKTLAQSQADLNLKLNVASPSTTGSVTFGGYGTGIIHSNSSGVLSSSAVDLASAEVTGILANSNTTATTASTPNTIVLRDADGGVPNLPRILSITGGINARATGTTALYTVPVGKILVVTDVYVKCTAVTGSTTGARADIGDSVNGAASIYANSSPQTAATNKIFRYPVGGLYFIVPAGATVNYNINTIGNGTSLTYQVTLIGVLQ